ncbi:MAG: hypothetical protein ACO1QB_09925 [Verrucomicrobiales bacterium]
MSVAKVEAKGDVKPGIKPNTNGPSASSAKNTNNPSAATKATPVASNMPPGMAMMPGGMPPGMAMMPGGMPPGMAMMPGGRARGGPGGMPGSAANVPTEIKDRVEKIQQSEILGQIVRPVPMGLIGIAGKQVFIRTTTGQTGMASEGEEFGGVKIIKVGTNHVLVEHEGEQKELKLFEGLGGETLISKGKENQQ